MRILCIALPALLLCPLASGQVPDSTCLEEIEGRIKPFATVTLVLKPEGNLVGEFLSVDPENSQFSLFFKSKYESFADTIALEQISSISFKERRQFRTAYLLYGVVGFLTGALIGQLVEQIIDPSYSIRFYPFAGGLDYEDGARIGAVTGLVAGIALPLLIPKHTTIQCK